MRFRTVSKLLVTAVLAGGAGACGARQTDTTDTVVPPPPAPARPEGWTRVSILALLDRHAPVPADARGVYVRTPHCTTAVRLTGSIRRMLLNLASDIVTPSALGMAPPDRPVPAPRATTGTPSAWQVRSTAATCASVSGRATTSGRVR